MGRRFAGQELVDNVLRVPNGFLGRKLLALWLHPNYILLEDFLARNAKVDKLRKSQFHLVGTPGIGKTYFGHYWLFKQAKAGKRVIWRTRAGVFICYDFALEDPFVQASFQYGFPRPWTEEIETIWLMVVDGDCKGVRHCGFVLQCVAPARGGYHAYAKDLGTLCHLEAWTLEELMECRDALKLGFTDDELEERFYYCGGLPRLVLDRTKTSSSLKGTMVRVLPSWEAVILHAASGADKDAGTSDHLIHYQLKRELKPNALPSDCVLDYELKFASAYVEDLVHDEYQRQGHDKVKAFFGFCRRMPEARALLGRFFERRVHRTLRDGGGEFSVKDLEMPGGPLSVLELKPSSTKRIRRWQVATYTPSEAAGFGKEESAGLASLDRGCFVDPYSATFDSPDIMIQCTYSLEHKIFWAPVLEVVQEYDRWYSSRGSPPPRYYSLIFAVPEGHLEDFKFQGYKKENGSDYEGLQPGMRRVRPFALAFPWFAGLVGLNWWRERERERERNA